MQVHTIASTDSFKNLTYLISAPDQKSSFFCIDPYDGPQVLEYLNKYQLTLSGILNTHNHWDHVRGNEFLKKTFNCPVYRPEDLQNLESGEFTSLYHILKIPGHTMEHVGIIACENNQPSAFFSGDTLFNAGVGNCLHGGDVEALYHTLTEKIAQLPDETSLYPGHNYWEKNLAFTLKWNPSNPWAREILDGMKPISTLGLERKINLFLNLQNPECLQNLAEAGHLQGLGPWSERTIFITLRKLRDLWNH